MRLASKASGTTSVAPAALSSRRGESSAVRTSTGTSARSRRRRAQDGERNARIRERDDHRVGVGETDLLEHLLVGGVAVHHRLADLPRGTHAHRVEIDGDVFEALRLEHARHVLSDAAEAAQDDVLALGHRQRGGVLALDRGLRRAALAQQQRAMRLLLARITGASTMRQHHRHQHRLRDGRIDGLVLQQQREQRDAEFAAHREREAGAQRLEGGVDEQARGEGGDRRVLRHTMRPTT